jgi:hypothetical protein
MLGVFASSKLELTARPDGAFDLVLRPVERAGLGSGALEAIATIARGLPYRTAYFDLLNLRGAAVNLISLVRWDPSSRRAAAELSRPLRGDPRKRLEVRLDARRERWRLPASSDFTLQSVGGEAAFRALGRGGWGWSSGAALAHRRFGDPPREAASFEDGPLLCWRAGGSGPILAIPERRFEMRASSSFEVGRVLTGTRGVFAQLGAGIAWQWLPRARGEAGRIAGSLRAGRTAGEAPFDALYDLGLDRDRDLALRGHAGTRAGHKGTGPRGRDYILASAELDAVTLRAGLVEMALGPFLDAARVGRLLSGTPHGWLVDAGVQTRLRVAGSVGVVLSYGRDLRQGRGAFFATTSR